MTDAPWGLYEYLRPAQIDAIKAAASIAYLPWGALEWHGRQNPVGLDALKAHALCTAMAKKTGGVVLPPVYCGAQTMKPAHGFMYTLDHSYEVVGALCKEFLEQLADEGFRVVVLLMGHYGWKHVETIREAVSAFAARRPDVRVWAFPDWEPMPEAYGGNHAAKGETSYQMLFYPDTVDLAQLPANRAITLEEDGIGGKDPRESSAEYGQAMLDAFLAATVPKIKALAAQQ